ncbi:MAG: hypothetical protein AAFR14_11715, partial [Bacteroidota bacterium]
NAGGGLVFIYHLAFESGISGVSLGGNIDSIGGCFALSNAITVNRTSILGGELSLAGGGDLLTICDNGDTFRPFDVVIENAVGTNAGWLLTDGNGDILALPLAPPFDLEGTGSGTNLLWHISFEEGLTGDSIGANASDIDGCFALSNPITIIRNGVDGGSLAYTGGGEELTICVGDSIPDVVSVDLTGADGPNSAFVITDTAGVILEIRDTSVFDFEDTDPGVCLIWHLSFADDLMGAAADSNANDLTGCFDLSNPLRLIRVSGDDCPPPCEIQGGSIATVDSLTSLTICADDGNSDTFIIVVSEGSGAVNRILVTDEDGEILALPDSNIVNLEGAGSGICNIYSITSIDSSTTLMIGGNIDQLAGCFALSNAIQVERQTGDDCPPPCEIVAGNYPTDEVLTICADDGRPDSLTFIVEGATGENNVVVITDSDANILRILTEDSFDLEGIGSNTALVWGLTFDGELSGAEIGANANDLIGCFALSNPLQVNLLTEDECGCGADAGSISTTDGENEIEFCSGDASFMVEADSDADSSLFYFYVVTDDEDIIIEWRLRSEGGLYEW